MGLQKIKNNRTVVCFTQAYPKEKDSAIWMRENSTGKKPVEFGIVVSYLSLPVL